jgi:hypothetical protein
MAEKNWVDLDQFIEAFSFALDFHAGHCQLPLGALLLTRSIRAAHTIRKRYYPEER